MEAHTVMVSMPIMLWNPVPGYANQEGYMGKLGRGIPQAYKNSNIFYSVASIISKNVWFLTNGSQIFHSMIKM